MALDFKNGVFNEILLRLKLRIFLWYLFQETGNNFDRIGSAWYFFSFFKFGGFFVDF